MAKSTKIYLICEASENDSEYSRVVYIATSLSNAEKLCEQNDKLFISPMNTNRFYSIDELVSYYPQKED